MQEPTAFGPARPHPRPAARRWLWNASQQRAISVVLLAATLGVGLLAWQRPVTVLDPQPEFPARYADLADRLDPNTAPAARLAMLPGIGPSKAEAIVAYRKTVPSGRVAFSRPEDLAKVRGIGPALVARTRQHLIFETP